MRLQLFLLSALMFNFSQLLAFETPAPLTQAPSLGQLDCPFPNSLKALKKLQAAQVVSVKCKHPQLAYKGLKFWVSIGDIAPFEAAALWWDIMGQTELFETKVWLKSGSLNSNPYEAVIDGPFLLWDFYQRSFYSTQMIAPEVYQIDVDVKEIRPYGEKGLEGYRFYRLGQQTIYEGFSMYNTGALSTIAMDLAAKQAAKLHRKRYVEMQRRPSPRQISDYHQALEK